MRHVKVFNYQYKLRFREGMDGQFPDVSSFCKLVTEAGGSIKDVDVQTNVKYYECDTDLFSRHYGYYVSICCKVVYDAPNEVPYLMLFKPKMTPVVSH